MDEQPKPAQFSQDTAIRRVERVPDQNRVAFYSNNALVVGTQWDIQMYFSLVHETEPGKFLAVEKVLVIMTPEHAARFVNALKKTLEGYEASQGAIRDIKNIEQPPDSAV
jgi:hypothetical protein